MQVLLATTLLYLFVVTSHCGSIGSFATLMNERQKAAAAERELGSHRPNPLADPYEAERSLLRGLGLSSRPRPSPNATLPSFMLELYKRMERMQLSPGLGCDFTDSQLDGNVIRSFPNHGKISLRFVTYTLSFYDCLCFIDTAEKENLIRTFLFIKFEFDPVA